MLASWSDYRKTHPSRRALRSIQSIAKIREFAEANFPNTESLPDVVFEQLFWFLENTIYTSESNSILPAHTEWQFIEIKRSLTRWHCLQLLQQGDEQSYQAFIASQPEKDCLTRESFRILSDGIQQLSIPVQDALWVTCFLAKSDIAKTYVKTIGLEAPLDSEQFLTDTINQIPRIYPIYNLLSPSAQTILPSAFLESSHARQMLYTEGGNNLFEVLHYWIKNHSLSSEQYDLWFARWIINIAGFRGHVCSKGSLYLTESTANDLLLLKSALDQLWEDPKHDVLIDYLQKRAENLGVNSLYLAHLGALARLHGPQEGSELNRWFNTLSSTEQKALEDDYEQFRISCTISPTYLPAVIDNLKNIGCDLTESLNLYVLITKTASQYYRQAIQDNQICLSTPLCYREIARKNILETIVSESRNGTLDRSAFQINENGIISYPQTINRLVLE